MQSRCSRLHEMAITQRDYISAGLGQSRSSPLRGPFDPPIPLHTRQNSLSVMPVTLLKRRCPDVGGELRGRRRRAPERAGCATLWSAGDALTGPRTGDWLSGRAPRSHRGGHWFDPSIAHRVWRGAKSRRGEQVGALIVGWVSDQGGDRRTNILGGQRRPARGCPAVPGGIGGASSRSKRGRGGELREQAAEPD